MLWQKQTGVSHRHCPEQMSTIISLWAENLATKSIFQPNLFDSSERIKHLPLAAKLDPYTTSKHYTRGRVFIWLFHGGWIYDMHPSVLVSTTLLHISVPYTSFQKMYCNLTHRGATDPVWSENASTISRGSLSCSVFVSTSKTASEQNPLTLCLVIVWHFFFLTQQRLILHQTAGMRKICVHEPQSCDLWAGSYEIADILPDALDMSGARFSSLPFHTVRKTGKDKLKASEETLLRVDVMWFSQLLKLRVMYTAQGF